MIQYQQILQKIIQDGVQKYPTRIVNGKVEPVDGGVKTLCCPNIIFSHEMSDGFPLLTTRKMAWKSIRVELEGFIKGITSKRWYQERGCHFWDNWANPIKVEEEILHIADDYQIDEWANYLLGKINEEEYTVEQEEEIRRDFQQKCYNKANLRRKEIQDGIDDLGAIYGFQWRRFNQAYDVDDSGWIYLVNKQDYDQLKNIVDTLHNCPNDRRMVCSAWNPNQRSRMGLEPCHWGFNLCATDDKLNLAWIQRSVDTLRGLPANIASYALLLLLLCKEGNLQPGNLTGLLVDCHLYEDQVDAAKEILLRKPLPLPKVEVTSIDDFDIFKWTHNDIIMTGRQSHDKIEKLGSLVV
jgi:thymidylate synthase